MQTPKMHGRGVVPLARMTYAKAKAAGENTRKETRLHCFHDRKIKRLYIH
jgi:hypothetical protein